MTSQGSSRVDYLDLTDEDDSVNDSAASVARPSAIAGPSLGGLGRIPPVPNNAEGQRNPEYSLVNESTPSPTEDSNSDIEMMDNAPVDAAARRRNMENRQERLRAAGIDEEDDESLEADRPGRQRGDSVAEVIVISDGEEANEAPNPGIGIDEDRFGEERRRQRRWNNWEDTFADGRRNPNARQPARDLFDFDFPPHLFPTAAGPSAPRITLGGGGIVSRNRPLLPPILPSNNAGPSMHRRSLQLDGQRLQGRVRTHVEGIAREADREYDNLGLTGRVRNAMNRLGDVFGAIGWGIGANDDLQDAPRDNWGPPVIRGGWNGRGRGARGRGGRGGVGGLFMGWGEPPAEEEERPLDLPEAPEWKFYFTHPGKMPHGFTSEFAPVEPELIILEDSDDETRKKKGKAKAKQPGPDPKAEARAREALTLVCSMCKDPLLLGGDTDNERVYGLRCGHVLDGKCVWKIGKPQEEDPPPQPQPSTPAETSTKDNKGKSRAIPDSIPSTMNINPEYEFTFVPPVEAPVIPSTPQSSAYVEDNAPSASRVRATTTLPARGRDRRGVVPIPNVSAGRRTRNRTRQNALDGVDDDGALLTDDAGPSTPRLDLSDPFFPVPLMTAQRGGGGRRGRSNRGGRGAGGSGRTRVRKVPKTNGRLKEQVFEWVCPVAGCGRAHASVRLEMEGAKWKCDPEKGPVLMFL